MWLERVGPSDTGRAIQDLSLIVNTWYGSQFNLIKICESKFIYYDSQKIK